MLDLLQSSVTQVMLWLAVLTLLVVVAVYGVRRFRDVVDEDEAGPSEMLSKFRDLHLQGDLSDSEFRTIKTVLGAKLQNKSKDNSDKG